MQVLDTRGDLNQSLPAIQRRGKLDMAIGRFHEVCKGGIAEIKSNVQKVVPLLLTVVWRASVKKQSREEVPLTSYDIGVVVTGLQ